MKTYTFIAVCLLTFTLCSCTKKSSSSSTGSVYKVGDSTFNSSYFQLSVNGKSFYEKDVFVDSAHLVKLTTSYGWSGTIDTLFFFQINVEDSFGIYGLQNVSLYCFGSKAFTYPIAIGTYPIANGIWGSLYNQITQANPLLAYSDTTGTVNVTHNGTDYIQGTINTTLYANGFTYPATGSFKIYN